MEITWAYQDCNDDISEGDGVSRRMPWELAVAVLAAAVGAVDAVVGGQTDLAVVFAAVVLLGLYATVRAWSSRHRVTLRADLASWLSCRAADRGTTVDDEAAYAIAAFRAGITPDSRSGEIGSE